MFFSCRPLQLCLSFLSTSQSASHFLPLSLHLPLFYSICYFVHFLSLLSSFFHFLSFSHRLSLCLSSFLFCFLTKTLTITLYSACHSDHLFSLLTILSIFLLFSFPSLRIPLSPLPPFYLLLLKLFSLSCLFLSPLSFFSHIFFLTTLQAHLSLRHLKLRVLCNILNVL